MPYATNNGVRLHWDEKGAGPPVLLVMGAAYSSRMWYPVVDALAAHHRVIWFDNRGIGLSDASRAGSIQDMAADAVAVLDAAGVDKAAVYGVSLGGVVVLQVALQSPERVSALVVGCSGILDDSKPRTPTWVNLLAHLPRGLFARMAKNGYGSAASPGAVAHDVSVVARDQASTAGLKQQQDALRSYAVSVDAVSAIAVPVLVLHGDEDKTVPLAYGQELAAAVPGAELVVYPGAGHNFLVSYPDKANADVLAFLTKG